MNLWRRFARNRTGVVPTQGSSLHFEKGAEPEFRLLCIRFVGWLRKKYSFPVHINIYIKNCEKIQLLDGRYAYGGFRYFENKPPYIRIPAKIEPHLREEYEDREIYYSILSSLVHELTHYYQWATDLNQSNSTSECQANYFRSRIIEEFCGDCGLPY